jgi:hypothetical protein
MWRPKLQLRNMKPWGTVFFFASVTFMVARMWAAEPHADLPPLPRFAAEQPGQPLISSDIMALKPFSVTGPRGALLGQQDGSFEAWIFPWKILSHMRITADMKDYPVPIDVNEQAATITVQPGHTTITFSHANFTVRETFFAPQQAPDGAGALAFYQIQAVRPMTLTFSFTPEMVRMWPVTRMGKDRDIGLLCAAPESSRSRCGRGHANRYEWNFGALPGTPQELPSPICPPFRSSH